MQTAISEVIEELGIKINDANFKFVMILPPLNGHSFSYQFVYLADKKISKFNLQKEEVDTVEYFKFSDLKNDMKKHERDYAMNYARYEPMLLEIEKIFKN
jgi:8-oxo-dGTP pyrophosphatase MutT (NUDIX family)